MPYFLRKTAIPEKLIVCVVRLLMTVIPNKIKRNGKEYYELIGVNRVGGKTAQKYAVYLGMLIGVDIIWNDLNLNETFLKWK